MIHQKDARLPDGQGGQVGQTISHYPAQKQRDAKQRRKIDDITQKDFQ